MHEYAVTKSLVELAVAQAVKSGATRINTISVVIGELASIIDDSVRLYFDLIAAGTIAQGARLEFRRVAAEFYCHNCQRNFPKPPRGFDCPACGALGSPTDIGKEFYIESMEIE